jgi:TolB-like protein
LLILPFNNYTGDDQLDIVISGMHSSLIGNIQHISDIKVISKITADAFKDVDMTLSEITSELGVDAVVEPAVMCLDDSICIELKMTTPEEEQIWFAEYKESKSQILNLNNRVTKQIAVEVKIELTADEEHYLAESPTVDPDALDAYFKGLHHYERVRKEDLEKAKEYFGIAIEKEPDWAAPYAGLGGAWGALGLFGFIPQNVAIPQMNIYNNRALELDPNSANSHYIKAMTATWWEWDWETGEREFLKSLELNPNDPLCRMYYAHLLMILRRSDEAVYHAQLGLKLNPLSPLVMGLYAVVMKSIGDHQSAITQCKKARKIM